MKTDVFIKLVSEKHDEEEMSADIKSAFRTLREFAQRFSRFDEESELSRFNRSEGGRISSELFSLLQECAGFYKLTGGIFDPGILSCLEKIGYGKMLKAQEKIFSKCCTFEELVLNAAEQSARKPRDLRLDLGGIGKGYAADLLANNLSKKYENGIVDAGGDMRVWGGDREQGISHWAIDVENPSATSQVLTTLLLSDRAVATSGVNRKHWKKNGETYHHLIDPWRKMSARSDLIQVTAIALQAKEADVLAKTLFIMGLKRGGAFAEEHNIPALFVTENKEVIRNSLFQKYEWQDQ